MSAALPASNFMLDLMIESQEKQTHILLIPNASITADECCIWNALDESSAQREGVRDRINDDVTSIDFPEHHLLEKRIPCKCIL
jgi:hypothetical protein